MSEVYQSVYQAVAWVRGDSQIHLSLFSSRADLLFHCTCVLSYDIDQKNMIAENSFKSMMLVRSNNIIAQLRMLFVYLTRRLLDMDALWKIKNCRI